MDQFIFHLNLHEIVSWKTFFFLKKIVNEIHKQLDIYNQSQSFINFVQNQCNEENIDPLDNNNNNNDNDNDDENEVKVIKTNDIASESVTISISDSNDDDNIDNIPKNNIQVSDDSENID